MKGRVAVLRDHRQDLEIEEFDVPDPAPRALLVKIKQAVICGSDLHVWRGEAAHEPFSPAGMGFGHEGFGVVDRIGDGIATDDLGKPLALGDRVIHYFAQTRPGRMSLNGGIREYGAFPYFVSTFGDYYYVEPDQPVFKVPDELPDDILPSVNCAMGSALNGLIAGGTTFGSVVVILGAGGLGLIAVAAANDMGASTVIVLDRLPDRLALAREFGADHTVNVDDVEDPEARRALIRELANGRKADVVLELAGLASLLPDGVAILGEGGTYVEVGMVFRGTTVAFDPCSILHTQQRIVGASLFPPTLIPRILDFLVRNQEKRPFEKLISHRVGLSHIRDGPAAADWSAAGPTATRVAIVP